MSVQELQNEVKLLREYTKALEIQNETRNQQRKFLEKQNDKLRALLEAAQNTPKNSDTLIIQIRKLQDKVERIEREKSNLQSSYDSLSKQFLSQRTNKVVTSSAVTSNVTSNVTNVQTSYQYTSLKSKYEYSEQQLTKLRLSEAKFSEEKIRLKQEVRSLEAMLSKVNAQLYTLQSSMELREGEISKLKNENSMKVSSTTFNKSQYEKVRSEVTEWTYKYDILERRYKTLQGNQRQFNKERTKFQTRISELEKKLSATSNQLYTAKSQVEMKVNEINRLKIDSLPPRSIVTSSAIFDKGPELEKTKSELQILKAKYEVMFNQNFELKKKSPYSYSLNTQTISMSSKQKEQKEALSRQNQSLRSQIRSIKLQQEAKFEYQIRQKNQEILRLQMRVESYEQRINDVSEQLEQQIRMASVQNQYQRDPILIHSANSTVLDGQKFFLKSELNKITLINQSLTNQIINIRKQHSYYLQRHHDMERRILILEETNLSLRNQLQISIQRRNQSPQVSRKRKQNHDLASDDQVYTIQVNSDIRNMQQSLNSNKSNHKNSRLANDAVFKERDIKNTFQVTHKTTNSLNDQKWKSLQYKIHKLKHENDQLKRTLYDMNDN